MRDSFVMLLLAAAMVFLPTGAAHALDNKVEASYETGSGEGFSVGKLEKGALALSYTKFFQGLSDDGSPYGAREFLQHPSYLAFSTERTRYEYDPVPPFFVSKREMDEYRVSGMFYPGDERLTGLGFSFAYTEDGVNGPMADSAEQKAFALKVGHYLADGLRVGLGYEKVDASGYPLEQDRDSFSADLQILIEKYWFSGWYSISDIENNDEDQEVMGLELGVYPLRELGIFASYEVFWEFLESTTTLRLRGEYWFSDKAKVGVVYKRVEEDAGHSFVGETAMLRLGLLF